jgi:glycosyltransferase involved in cell wall biosynthesis
MVSPVSNREVLRIGILAPPWLPVPPVGYGGTERVISRLGRGLQAAGHEVRLWTTGDSTCPVPSSFTFAAARTEVMGVSSIELRHTLEGYEWFAEEGCDVIHDHTLVGPFLGASMAPVITTNHGPFDNPELATIYRHLPRAIPLIAISRSQASVAPGLGIHVSHVIYHGIDVDEVPVGDGHGDEHGPYLLFLGRMNPAKGVVQAIEVARATGHRLLVAAKMREAGELEFYEHVVSPLCTDDIEYVGEVAGDEKDRLIGGATALLSPIQWPEPFGLMMIEALAAGTPVISTRRGAAPEIIVSGRTGFICDDNDALVRAVGSIEQIDRSECRSDVARRFSIDRMVAQHVAAYRGLLPGSRGDRHESAPRLSLV